MHKSDQPDWTNSEEADAAIEASQDVPKFVYTSRLVPGGESTYCATGASGTMDCTSVTDTCASTVDYEIGSDVVVDPRAQSELATGDDMVLVQRLRIDTATGTETHQGFSCVPRAEVGTVTDAAITITVTQEDFASMPVEPLVAHAGPPEGWLPVNMVNVLYAESEEQVLNTELLGTPVAVRATPVSYHWDLGDGNTITTDNPGEPFPSEQVSSTYRHQGWYDITLTTTFAGEFSVNGGPWQPIDGTIEVASEPVSIYSKSLESRLVNGDVPVDEEADPWIPERTAETEGTPDPEAQHREI